MMIQPHTQAKMPPRPRGTSQQPVSTACGRPASSCWHHSRTSNGA